MDAEDGRPARRVADELRRRIADGELRPGDRVPSTRRIVRDFGVAMATASRALARLREEGLIVTTPGSGSVVRAAERRPPPAPRLAPRDLTRARIVAAAVALADREGTDAVSMRGLAGRLGVTPMSLYHHVAGRDELELLMIRAVFRTEPLANVAPEGWRAQLEEVYRLQWRLYRRHPWLAGFMSPMRPPYVPEAMEHSERTLRALARLGLAGAERWRAAVALPALVRGLALTAADELRMAHETRMRTTDWWAAMEVEARRHFRSGRFPYLSAVEEIVVADDLDDLFEHSLTRYLDGLAKRAGAG
ncbi:TetR/AcrR family transcriptional regulator C-terminal domain-containing protein [Actinomadura sp. WAC 06369]|uniref:TetR/AcrR family transcriptional regulator C-terminal domain-containing protein n=1 Tax=Actinomadura sp. WAC 06369 TaxID=2203193 RepID=UPI000F7B11CC|nr:GntR family transcriptional regulator [Actinomadura sp. WAC 06369]RSN51800.1 GntR family transcriptional regulator [Actinomadura sp. WAC 06369]